MITKYKIFENSTIPELGDWVVFDTGEHIIGKLLWKGLYWSDSSTNYAVIIEEDLVNKVPEWVQKQIMNLHMPRIDDYSEYVRTWDAIPLTDIVFYSKNIENVRAFVESEKYNI